MYFNLYGKDTNAMLSDAHPYIIYEQKLLLRYLYKIPAALSICQKAPKLANRVPPSLEPPKSLTKFFPAQFSSLIPAHSSGPQC